MGSQMTSAATVMNRPAINAASAPVGVAAAAAPAQSAWLFSPVVDYACAGGLTFLVFLPVLLLNTTETTPALISSLLIWGNILVNCPHYAATYYRVYRDVNEVRKYPIEAVAVPAVLCAVAAACFVLPTSLTPWVAFAYLITSGYHYSGQTYGVSMIFSGKAGLRLTPEEKRSLRLPIYASYLYTVVNLNLADRDPLKVLETVVPSLNLPHVALDIAGALVVASLVMFVALNAGLYRRTGRALPLVVNVIVAAHLVWFTMVQFPTLVAVVPFLHCLQYLLITVFFDFKESRSRSSAGEMTVTNYFASIRFARYYVTQVAVGVALFVGLPLVLRTAGVGSKALVGAVVISVLNLHHFILDGAIWKLRKPAVGKPLLT